MENDGKDIIFEDFHGPIVDKYLKSNQSVTSSGFCKAWPSGCVLPVGYVEEAERIRRLGVREDDVWVVTYPKCGTTWTQEMTWLLVNNLDYDAAKATSIVRRSPFMEFGSLTKGSKSDLPDTVAIVENLKPPRVIKSHLPLQLLPYQLWTVKPKIIYVAREAKDVAVSYYHHHRLVTAYTGTIQDFVEAFVEGSVMYGSLWDHILEFWKIRDEPYILFNTYEEMKKDLPGVVQRTAKFLNRSLDSRQLEELCEHLSFESMKKNPSTNLEEQLSRESRPKIEGKVEPFMRKGQVGNWKAELTMEDAEKIDKWTEEKLKGSDYVLQ